ncbi:phosphodiester glycosidase family protein [Alloalcanivorax xenomutans]|uniref:Phosphodiester glycosidase family protein n=1 Tax=Alloalcanivorax xenomutans TaxID=1094342 RepID=A0A9Q3VXX1_9GAMM|nr:phosphodiester glycosidase family protein [Alloalcanivorax xenomutans]MCE7507125.1 phosphodiester glycosidase family protein [Alloalcanivorax xenomutans]
MGACVRHAGRWRAAVLPALIASLLAGCGGDTDTKFVDKIVEVPVEEDVPYVEDLSGAETFTANIIAAPDGADDQFQPHPAPVVNGVTARETEATLISDYQRFQINTDLSLTSGRLNHVRDEGIFSAEFTTGGSLSLVPLTRSNGQFSFERTTASANHAIDNGQNVILAVNADPYNMTQGWNMGLIKKDGVTYTGFSDRNEQAIVVYQDGSPGILEQVPEFTLNVYHNGQLLEPLGKVHYFDNASQANTSFSRGGSELELYPAESYRGTVDLTGRSAALIAAEANGVSVVARGDGEVSVQLPPLSGTVVGRVEDRAHYVVPAGHALLVDGGALSAGSRVDIRYETDDPSWDQVESALGAGFGRGLLVKDGQLGSNQDEVAVSSRTAFGIRADGSAFFLVVDKPVGSLYDGITQTKLGQIMIGYGAVQAINLDGGGSSTLAARLPGERYTYLVNTPSDGAERVTATKWGLVLNAEQARYDANAVAVYPRELTVMAGAVYRRFRGVGYDSASWEGGGDIPEYGISDASLGLIDSRTGAFKAADADAQGYVVVRVGEQKGVARVRVTSTIDEIRFPSEQYAVDSGSSLQLTPLLISDGDSVHYSNDVISYELDNTDDCALNPETGVLSVAPVQGRSCTVTATAAGKSASTVVNIGVAPELVTDFEGDTSAFAPGGARHKAVNIEKVSDQVFSGNYSMKLSWEADPAQPGTFGAYLTDPGQVTELPGYPKYLGVNVYIPDELAGKVWWVRGSLKDADGKTVTLNYNNDGDALPERGWHFMKAEIGSGYREPLRFFQPFRFLVLKTAERIDSHVILDDFTAIYSDDTDLAGPGVTVSPQADATVEQPDPLLSLQVHDDSGVDFGSAYVALDGQDVSASLTNNGQDRIEFQSAGLADGWHRVDYRVADTNGNVTAGDYLFQVLTGGPRVYIDSANIQFYPGGTFQVPIRVEGGGNFGDLNLSLDYDATKAAMTVIDGDLSATDVSTTEGNWSGRFTGFNDNTGVVAYLELKVRDYIQNTFVSVVVNGQLDGDTYYHPVVRKEVGSRYRLLTHWGISGQQLDMLVVDQQGNAASGVTVETFTYNSGTDQISDVVVLGTTDAEGRLAVTLPAGSDSQDLLFRAYDDQGSSLMTDVQALVERLTPAPRHVYLTPGSDGSQVNVTWYTSTDVSASEVAYGAGSLNQSATGESGILPFFYGSEAGVVRVHHVALDNLTPGTTYRYRVGDGAGNQSVEFSFTTDDGDDQVNIHLFGDTQTLSNENIFNGSGLVTELYQKMQAQLPDGDLILHVGDLTEDLSDYRLVRLFLESLEGDGMLASRLLVPTEGNHEVYNEGAEKFAAMFRFDPTDSGVADPFEGAIYSFDYGNTHIAVLTSELTEERDWPKMMDWLRADMSASDQTWKIVMIHRPPYNGNPASGNGRVMQYLPPLVDELGIDLVLSGHDHMYSRSVPMAGGQPHPAGATYLIAGSDSAKYYDNNGGGIAKFADVLFDDNVNTYTTLQIDGENMHVLTRTLDGTVVDDTIITPRAGR